MSNRYIVEDDKKRLEWIDSIKGIFILLVVFGHLTAGVGGRLQH